ncbi:hypothetical protein SCHPADRAFT_335389 [Schizopora paradoxa]|uniref:Uncharacterized protein n=1 Tax=Schizopora paradoxa TaxID=27342 RepID=A0A0H2SAY2_9AGAM|nr:hypothetical protein SCHPADRAFT_335389 [Schizopora paradoxa]
MIVLKSERLQNLKFPGGLLGLPLTLDELSDLIQDYLWFYEANFMPRAFPSVVSAGYLQKLASLHRLSTATTSKIGLKEETTAYGRDYIWESDGKQVYLDLLNDDRLLLFEGRAKLVSRSDLVDDVLVSVFDDYMVLFDEIEDPKGRVLARKPHSAGD